MLEIFDPTAATGANSLVYARRPHSLKGLRVALVENTNHNSAEVLERIGKILVEEYGVAEARLFRKKHSSTPMHEAILEDIRKNFDVAIAGVGDCGSCSAAIVLDGIMVERVNKPAAAIVTNFFASTAKAMAKQAGVPDYRFLIMQHPIGNLDDEGLNERARTSIDGIVQTLVSSHAGRSWKGSGMTQASGKSIEEALVATFEGLDAAGYSLDLAVEGTTLAMTVVAREGACEDCLVPKPLFIQMVTDELHEGGHRFDAVSASYPKDRQ